MNLLELAYLLTPHHRHYHLLHQKCHQLSVLCRHDLSCFRPPMNSLVISCPLGRVLYMENHKQVKIYLKKEAIEQIQDVIEFKKVKDLLDKRESEYKSVEEFIVGCVYYYLKQIDSVEDISNIRYLITEHQLKNRFEELMIKKGWNQKELVERTGISAGNINNILKNKNQASIDNFFRIWIAFNCPPISNVLYRSDE